jgi:hypothetical protein
MQGKAIKNADGDCSGNCICDLQNLKGADGKTKRSRDAIKHIAEAIVNQMILMK